MPAVLTKTGLRVRERDPPPARPLPAFEPVAATPWYSRPQSARPFAGVFGGTASSRNSDIISNTAVAAYGRSIASSRGRPRSAEPRQQRSRSSSSKENHQYSDANSSRASLGRSRSAGRRKPEWDSGVQDPAQYRLSKEERAAKSRYMHCMLMFISNFICVHFLHQQCRSCMVLSSQ
jgi:hypothetical protein